MTNAIFTCKNTIFEYAGQKRKTKQYIVSLRKQLNPEKKQNTMLKENHKDLFNDTTENLNSYKGRQRGTNQENPNENPWAVIL